MKQELTIRKKSARRSKSKAQEIAERKRDAMNRLKAFWQEYQNMTPEQQEVIQTAAKKLGNYSIRNTILIYLQADARGFEPSAVCPFSAWKQVGRRIKKGEKGLQILVPMHFKGKEAPTPDDCAMVLHGHDFEMNDGSTPGHTWFKVAHVFDLSQTELEEEAVENALPAPETDGDQLLLAI